MPPHSFLLSLLPSLQFLQFKHFHVHFPLMDAKPLQLASQPPLNYQTWFLKVSIHCEGCRRKVKKVLKSIDGVFTATIDQQQQKVTVTGSVGVETLLRKLVRAGKHAEIWPENLAGDGKISGKGQKKKKKSEARHSQSFKNNETENATTTSKCNNNSMNKSNNSPEKSPSGDQVPPVVGRSEGSGKKKKKKGHSGGNGYSSGPAHPGLQFQDLVGQEMGPVNVSPTRQQYLSYPECGYHPMIYVATYNRLYPMAKIWGPSYYVPSSPYMCAGLDQDAYHFQSPPLVSFEIFSDENANGCSIM